MSKQRVALWNKPQGFAVVETDATVGAVLGENLRNKDGSLVTLQQLQPVQGDAQGGIGKTVWRYVLEIPKNVQAVSGLDGSGFVRRDGDAWSAAPIVNADLAGADTSGLKEGLNLYHTESRVRSVIDTYPPGGIYMPLTDGQTPPGLIYNADGSLIYTRVA